MNRIMLKSCTGKLVPHGDYTLLNQLISKHIIPHYILVSTTPPATTKYYLNLEIINNANTTVTVQFEGNTAPIRIAMRGVVQIREVIISIKAPVGNVYRVYEEGSSNTLLYLNGKQELNIVPSTEDQVYRIFITGEGKKLSQSS